MIDRMYVGNSVKKHYSKMLLKILYVSRNSKQKSREKGVVDTQHGVMVSVFAEPPLRWNQDREAHW